MSNKILSEAFKLLSEARKRIKKGEFISSDLKFVSKLMSLKLKDEEIYESLIDDIYVDMNYEVRDLRNFLFNAKCDEVEKNEVLIEFFCDILSLDGSVVDYVNHPSLFNSMRFSKISLDGKRSLSKYLVRREMDFDGLFYFDKKSTMLEALSFGYTFLSEGFADYKERLNDSRERFLNNVVSYHSDKYPEVAKNAMDMSVDDLSYSLDLMYGPDCEMFNGSPWVIYAQMLGLKMSLANAVECADRSVEIFDEGQDIRVSNIVIAPFCNRFSSNGSNFDLGEQTFERILSWDKFNHVNFMGVSNGSVLLFGLIVGDCFDVNESGTFALDERGLPLGNYSERGEELLSKLLDKAYSDEYLDDYGLLISFLLKRGKDLGLDFDLLNGQSQSEDFSDHKVIGSSYRMLSRVTRRISERCGSDWMDTKLSSNVKEVLGNSWVKFGVSVAEGPFNSHKNLLKDVCDFGAGCVLDLIPSDFKGLDLKLSVMNFIFENIEMNINSSYRLDVAFDGLLENLRGVDISEVSDGLKKINFETAYRERVLEGILNMDFMSELSGLNSSQKKSPGNNRF